MAKLNKDKFLNNNENLPISTEIDWAQNPEFISEMKKCREDVFYFAENYFYIKVLGKGRQKIKLFEPQKAAIQLILDNSYTIVCASRQIGKSTLMTVVCLWYAIFQKDFTIAVLANKEDIAKEILERIKMAYEELPNWLKAGVWEFTKEHVKLTNGSKIEVSTTSQDAVRGKSIDLLFLDEFAHVRKEIADDFYKSVIPTITSSPATKLVITSTPKGTDNKYYQIYSEAEKGRNGWAYIKIFWHEIPRYNSKGDLITPEEWKKKVLALINYDMELWKQEYDIQFLEQGTASINGDLIEKMKRGSRLAEITFNDSDYSVFVEPQDGHIYVFGVDAAQGVNQDFSVAQILDITDLRNIVQAGIYATNKEQPYVFAEKLNQIARSWGRPFLCVESNKEGGQVLDALMNTHNYDNIVYYNMENDSRGYYQKPGIFCHPNSKYTGITNMKYWVEHLESVTVYDIATIKEFETFIRKENKTWGAKKGFKDDRVMALIWALILLESDIAERYLDILEYDEIGKPLRIADPNADLAHIALERRDKIISHAKTGGAPSPALFARGYMESVKEVEMNNMFGNGFKLIV